MPSHWFNLLRHKKTYSKWKMKNYKSEDKSIISSKDSILTITWSTKKSSMNFNLNLLSKFIGLIRSLNLTAVMDFMFNLRLII